MSLGVPEDYRVRGRPPRRGRVRAGERPPRRGLILTSAAAVMAIAFGVYVYHENASVEGPANDTPTATPTGAETPTDKAPPTGVIPNKYLGTWKGTIENDLGRNTRWMVIRQGEVGDTVMTLTAIGPTDGGGVYRCVFQARLESVHAGAIETSGSTVISAKPPSSCQPGTRSTLTLVGEDNLRRAGSGDRGTTYSRSQ
ncbi:hypothetical protein [Streptomyces sp. NPDC058308]|uniref:hypothetical protein n=1 Tax=Streptomyces sp. NPDC058308 TaxID=3346440 RepID=UPI0036E2C917